MMHALFLLVLGFFAYAEEPTYVSKQYPEVFATGLVHTATSDAFIRRAPQKSFTRATTPVPATYSMRGTTGQIESQGSCGSCWDFAVTSTLRGTLAAAGRDPGRLSFNYLLNCNSKGASCYGGSLDVAEDMLDPYGPPKYGVDGEYTGSRGSCQRSTAAGFAAQYFMLGPNGEGPSFKDISYVVGVLHRPVTIFITADRLLQSYAGGIYNGCSRPGWGGGNHIVVIEGYNCETSLDRNGNCKFDSDGNLPPGVGTYVIRNSWGKNWGDHGYLVSKATAPNGERCNGIATYAMYFEL